MSIIASLKQNKQDHHYISNDMLPSISFLIFSHQNKSSFPILKVVKSQLDDRNSYPEGGEQCILLDPRVNNIYLHVFKLPNGPTIKFNLIGFLSMNHFKINSGIFKRLSKESVFHFIKREKSSSISLLCKESLEKLLTNYSTPPESDQSIHIIDKNQPTAKKTFKTSTDPFDINRLIILHEDGDQLYRIRHFYVHFTDEELQSSRTNESTNSLLNKALKGQINFNEIKGFTDLIENDEKLDNFDDDGVQLIEIGPRLDLKLDAIHTDLFGGERAL